MAFLFSQSHRGNSMAFLFFLAEDKEKISEKGELKKWPCHKR